MIIGTAGHIDHGKTSLVKALTGIDADRLKEEKARGITLDLGYAYKPLANGDVLGFVDVPGHEKLIHNMLAGATGIDFVLLVIAADDGPMPQTREHLAILQLLGLTRGAVVLSKIDRVAPERFAAAQAEVRALLRLTSLQDAPVFGVSSVTGQGIAELQAYLENQSWQTALCRGGGHFRLAIDRVFTLSGTGTVVTGTVHSGQVKIGDNLVVSPGGLPVKVRGIHTQNQPADYGSAGQRCAINITGQRLQKDDIARGDWLLAAPVHSPVQRFDVLLHIVATEERAFRHWTPIHLHIGACDVMARVSLLQGETVQPGQSVLAQLVTDQPVGALAGDRFVLRDQSALRTLGGGQVVDIFPPTRNRRTPARLALLQYCAGNPVDKILAEMLEHSAAGVDLNRVAINWNCSEEDMQHMYQQLPMRVVNTATTSLAFAERVWQQLADSIVSGLAHLHEQEPDSLGAGRERLRRVTLPALSAEAFNQQVDELLSAGRLAQSGPWLHLPDHKVRLNSAEQVGWEKIRPLLEQQPFEPPRVRDIARSLQQEEGRVRQLLKRVARTGEVYLVAHDHYFTSQAVTQLAQIASEQAKGNGMVKAAEFRDLIGTGRKLAIQILEFFDRTGFTRRTGDEHRLRQNAPMP